MEVLQSTFFTRICPGIRLISICPSHREESLRAINRHFEDLKGYIEKSIPGIRIVPKYNVWKLQCKLDGATVKIEVNGPRGA